MATINKPTATLVKSLIAIAIGVIFIKWPSTVNNAIVVCMGIVLIMPLLYAVISVLFKKGPISRTSIFPLAGGCGSAVLGAIMIFMPQTFSNFIALMVGAVLIIAGARQIIIARRYKREGATYLFYIVPLIMFIIGLITIINFRSMADTLWIIIGIAFVVYGIDEILSMYVFRSIDNRKRIDAEDAEILK